jgi:hypothetical protein
MIHVSRELYGMSAIAGWLPSEEWGLEETSKFCFLARSPSHALTVLEELRARGMLVPDRALDRLRSEVAVCSA